MARPRKSDGIELTMAQDLPVVRVYVMRDPDDVFFTFAVNPTGVPHFLHGLHNWPQ